jgi:hypothetical protein
VVGTGGVRPGVEHLACPVDVVGFEVGDTDPVDQASLVEPVERGQRRRGVVLAGRPVDVQQVDVIGPESVQALLGRGHHRVGVEVRYPELRGEKYLLAGDGGGVDTLADRALVPVYLCGVDVSVAHLERPPDTLATLVVVVVLPGSETEHRHPVGGRHVVWCQHTPTLVVAVKAVWNSGRTPQR